MTGVDRKPPAWFALALIAALGAGITAATYEGTRERVAANERRALRARLAEVLPPGAYDNDPAEDWVALDDGAVTRVYVARRGGDPIAAVLRTATPRGYGGTITLLVGIDRVGTVNGVRVLSHRETPGLGDAIEAQRSDWVLGFAGKSLQHPRAWAVRGDGGTFDQFTGATITPRAVVGAVHTALLYWRAHRERILATAGRRTP